MLTIAEIENRLQLHLDVDGSLDRRRHNVRQFNNIPRNMSLFGGNKDYNLVAYENEFQFVYDTTTRGEKVYMRGPGKESVRPEKQFLGDLKPVIPNIPGKNAGTKDMTAGVMFTTAAQLFDKYPYLTTSLMLIILRIAYLQGNLIDYYTTVEQIKPDARFLEDSKGKIQIKDGYSSLYNHYYEKLNEFELRLSIYKINFEKELWDTLNTMIDMSGTDFEGLSFEAYIRYFEMIVQNEDCKYDSFEKNRLVNNPPKRKRRVKDNAIGRVNTARSAMMSKVISCEQLSTEEKEKILQNMNRVGGMRPAPLNIVKLYCGNALIINDDEIDD